MSADMRLVLGIVVVSILAGISGGFYIRQYNDCNAKGGVLVKNAYDWPTCVEMRTK